MCILKRAVSSWTLQAQLDYTIVTERRIEDNPVSERLALRHQEVVLQSTAIITLDALMTA
jgi:hypothetical protein